MLNLKGGNDVYKSVEECNNKAPLPDNTIGAFFDLWALLDHIAPDKYGKGSNQTLSIDFAKKRLEQKKLGMQDLKLEPLCRFG